MLESILKYIPFSDCPTKRQIHPSYLSITFHDNRESQQFLPGVRESIRHKLCALLWCLSLSLRPRPAQPPAIHGHYFSKLKPLVWMAFMLSGEVYLCRFAPILVDMREIPYHIVHSVGSAFLNHHWGVGSLNSTLVIRVVIREFWL